MPGKKNKQELDEPPTVWPDPGQKTETHGSQNLVKESPAGSPLKNESRHGWNRKTIISSVVSAVIAAVVTAGITVGGSVFSLFGNFRVVESKVDSLTKEVGDLKAQGKTTHNCMRSMQLFLVKKFPSEYDALSQLEKLSFYNRLTPDQIASIGAALLEQPEGDLHETLTKIVGLSEQQVAELITVIAKAKPDDGKILIAAAQEGDLEVMKYLLGKGADVNAKLGIGWTALMAAAGRGNAEAVKFLLDKGADVNAKLRSGRTALMAAAEQGNAEVVKFLLDAGANVNARERDGDTALMMLFFTLNGLIFSDYLGRVS